MTDADEQSGQTAPRWQQVGWRSSPTRVVLVNAISASWAEASAQADSVSQLITELRAGGSYSFESAC